MANPFLSQERGRERVLRGTRCQYISIRASRESERERERKKIAKKPHPRALSLSLSLSREREARGAARTCVTASTCARHESCKKKKNVAFRSVLRTRGSRAKTCERLRSSRSCVPPKVSLARARVRSWHRRRRALDALELDEPVLVRGAVDRHVGPERDVGEAHVFSRARSHDDDDERISLPGEAARCKTPQELAVGAQPRAAAAGTASPRLRDTPIRRYFRARSDSKEWKITHPCRTVCTRRTPRRAPRTPAYR